jgi:hypothetical protein
VFEKEKGVDVRSVKAMAHDKALGTRKLERELVATDFPHRFRPGDEQPVARLVPDAALVRTP